jgi:hypothetical protein
MGFELNPFGTCVANKMIDGKQCTIAWYIDNNKISHMDEQVSHHQSDREDRGEISQDDSDSVQFLGMGIKFCDKGTASIKMKDYIKEAIQDFGEDITKTSTSPARKNLFEIDETSGALTEANCDTFHSVVAELLYVSKCGRLHTTGHRFLMCKSIMQY